jgi:selenocysteine lyase/cysteine desulfurase
VLLCSPYKFVGPHLGVAAIGRELAERLPADRVRAAAASPPGHRFETGTGNFAELIGKRFDLACQRLGLNRRSREPLDISRFRPPRSGPQLDLF